MANKDFNLQIGSFAGAPLVVGIALLYFNSAKIRLLLPKLKNKIMKKLILSAFLTSAILLSGCTKPSSQDKEKYDLTKRTQTKKITNLKKENKVLTDHESNHEVADVTPENPKNDEDPQEDTNDEKDNTEKTVEDVKQFTSLGNNYAKDDKFVYFNSQVDGPIKLEEADINSFIALNGEDLVSTRSFRHETQTIKTHSFYAKDKDGVFYEGNKLAEANAYSFQVLGNIYGKDNKNAFYEEQKLEGVDVNSLVLLKPSQINNAYWYFYVKDKNHVYHQGQKIQEANADTFELLTKTYSKDKNHVFSYNEKIESADVNTFQVMGNYARDKNHVYFGATILTDVDSSSFKVFENWRYFSDKSGVYYAGKGRNKIENADIDSFETLKWDYARDKNHVYNHGQILEGFNSESFAVLTEAKGWPTDEKPVYIKDKNQVRLHDQTLEEADPATFQLMKGGYYAKDKNNIYWYGSILNGADVASFKVVGEAMAEDKNKKYRKGSVYPAP